MKYLYMYTYIKVFLAVIYLWPNGVLLLHRNDILIIKGVNSQPYNRSYYQISTTATEQINLPFCLFLSLNTPFCLLLCLIAKGINLKIWQYAEVNARHNKDIIQINSYGIMSSVQCYRDWSMDDYFIFLLFLACKY